MTLATAPALVLAMSFAVPVDAQDPGSAASSAPQASEQTQTSAPSVYEGAKTAVSDTLITLKVKAAFLRDQALGGNDIHVSTTDGIVTLMGSVHDVGVMTHAEQIARSTSSVRDVVNQLQVVGSSSDSNTGSSNGSNTSSSPGSNSSSSTDSSMSHQ